MFLRTEIPNHSPDAGEKQDEANHAPNYSATRRAIADQLLVRPILRVGNVLTRAICARCPSRPPEECRHLALFCQIAECTRRDGVLVSTMTVDIPIIVRQLLKCCRVIATQDNGI